MKAGNKEEGKNSTAMVQILRKIINSKGFRVEAAVCREGICVESHCGAREATI